MNESVSRKQFFQAGGLLPADAQSYIERPADTEALDLIAEGKLCLLLAPRQSGKSSLLMRAMARLRAEGAAVAYIDLQRMGGETDPGPWFGAVAQMVRKGLKLKTDARAWWRENAEDSPTQRFTRFLEEVVFEEISGRVVLLFDEVDSALKLPFSDDLFTTIRSWENARAYEPAYQRLSIALSGQARATEFVKDRSRTPFNVGESVELTDFTPDRMGPFRKVLGEGSESLVERIFYWTGGQPLLTQRLASAAYGWEAEERTPERLDRLVREEVLDAPLNSDVHFKSIRDFLAERAGPVDRVMKEYRKALKGRPVAYFDRNPAHEGLRLSGLLKVESGVLRLRNELYRHVFTEKWTKQMHRPDRSFIAAIGYVSLATAVITAVLLINANLFGLSAGALLTVVVVSLALVLLWFTRLKPLMRPEFQKLYHFDWPWYDREIVYTRERVAVFKAKYPSSPVRKIKLVRKNGPTKGRSRDLSVPVFSEHMKETQERENLFPVGLEDLDEGKNEFELLFFGPLKQPSFRTRVVAAYWPEANWIFPPDLKEQMVHIPAGEFMMGQTEEEKELLINAYGQEDYDKYWKDEMPRHPVKLTKNFYMQKTVVTQSQWELVMGYNPSWFGQCGADCPVENISWEHVKEFIRRLNILEGKEVYRMPTEAEWEYACRAGTDSILYNGDIEFQGLNNAPELDPIAWYGGNSGVLYEGGWDSSGWEGKQHPHKRAGTHPVGLKQPNAWGLYDTIGNVAEWCEGWYSGYPEDAVIDPSGPSTGAFRVLRGGSWFYNARGCRPAYRGYGDPDNRGNDVGFRLVARAAQFK